MPVDPVTPTVNAPLLTLDVSARVIETTVPAPKDVLDGTTAVNGGAKDPSGNGFNVDAQGNIVAIGSNVRVWGTETSKGPDGQTAIHDFAQPIQVYHSESDSFSVAQFGTNLIRYGYTEDLAGNSANANAPQHHTDNTDLFLLHSQSGVWMGNGSKPDGEYGSWQGFNNLTGNTATYADYLAGKTPPDYAVKAAPDYVVLIGDAASGAKLNTPTSNNAQTQINVLESLNIQTSSGKTVGQGLNKIEGVMAGGQWLLKTPGHDDVSQSEPQPAGQDQVLQALVYDVRIAAQLNDIDGSGEALSSSLRLDGVPRSASVYYNDQLLQANADGSYTIAASLAADGQSLHALLTIHAGDTNAFTLTAQAQSHSLQSDSDASTAEASVNVARGEPELGSLLGSADDDFLLGTDHGEQLWGGTGNDTLDAGAGNDTLIGGQGNDLLIGGAGDDQFVWQQGDAGTAAAPAVDVVRDFNHGHDVLDLRDLLEGERGSASLDNWLGASSTTHNGQSSTVLHISTTGKLAAEGANQTIVLEGVDFAQADGAALIRDLIDQGKLLVSAS